MEIVRKVARDGTITDPLVKRVENYPAEHFLRYVLLLHSEMGKRDNMIPPNWQVQSFNDNLRKAVDCRNVTKSHYDCYGCIRTKGQSDSSVMTKCHIFGMRRMKGLDVFSFPLRDLFVNWHDLRYLNICYMHLLEFKDCGIITEEEFSRIDTTYNSVMKDYCCVEISQSYIDKAYEEAIKGMKSVSDDET